MTLTQEQALQKINEISNSIFIYPTDTIYGIGCDAQAEDKVEKIREIKGRDMKSFSVITPSKKWILENLETSEQEIDKYLPGKYTKKERSRFYEICFRKRIFRNKNSRP